jgi:hypothetical protein
MNEEFQASGCRAWKQFRTFAVKPAPLALRYAILGLDRSVRPINLADHATGASRCRNK